MPIFLDTRGKSNLAIAICDRCRRKVPHADITADPDTNLMVCADADCVDEPDPWRLPPRRPDRIALAFVRSERSLTFTVDAEAEDDAPASEDGDFGDDFNSDYS
jgi:hypothetical protein